MFKILIIDDDVAIQELLRRVLQKQGYDVTVASNGEEGILQAQELRPALIICDWIMPRLTGIEVCRQVKDDPRLVTTFFILLTSLGSVADRVKGLDAGADDFISKPIEISELQARVRSGLRLHQLSQDLRNQKQLLETELAEAAEYVRSLLPETLLTPIHIDAKFIPSRQLGGDSFDYFWLDDDHIAIYLLDVAGHGLRAALPSVSVLNLLRSQAIPNINYHQPSDVIKSLNSTFQINYQNDKYFTIWYGVYDLSKKQLIYASAGHPPAILVYTEDGETQFKKLKTPGLPVGMFPEATYTDETCTVDNTCSLYLFSDGAYEIQQGAGEIWGLEAFINLLVEHTNNDSDDHDGVESILQYLKYLNSGNIFDDDLSLLKIKF